MFGPIVVNRPFKLDLFSWIYFLRSIKTLHINFSGDYLSIEFWAFLASKDIIHQWSYLTLQQNGVVEYKNRNLLDVVHTLLL